MSNHHHKFMMHDLMHSPMSKIYVFQALIMFVKTLVGIFAPVYLYSIGYSISSLMFFGALFSATTLIVIPLAVSIIRKIGFKYTIFLSMPFYLLLTLFIDLSVNGLEYALLAWVFYGVHVGLFWPAYHSEIAVNGDTKKRANEIGTLQIITTLFAAIAPFVGGYLLEFLSYTLVFILATVLMLISVLPLFLSKDITLQDYSFGYKDYMRVFREKRYKKTARAFYGEAIDHSLSFFVWPLVLFLVIGSNFFSLGVILTLATIISILIITYIKKRLDRQDKHQLLKNIIPYYSLTYTLKAIAIFIGGFFIAFIESISKVIIDIVRLPFVSIFYNNAKRFVYMDYIILRELYIHIGKIIINIIFGLIFLFVPEAHVLHAFAVIIFTGTLASFWLNYMVEK